MPGKDYDGESDAVSRPLPSRRPPLEQRPLGGETRRQCKRSTTMLQVVARQAHEPVAKVMAVGEERERLGKVDDLEGGVGVRSVQEKRHDRGHEEERCSR